MTIYYPDDPQECVIITVEYIDPTSEYDDDFSCYAMGLTDDVVIVGVEKCDSMDAATRQVEYLNQLHQNMNKPRRSFIFPVGRWNQE